MMRREIVMKKLLTISIAAYNVEDVLKQCVDSFLPSKHLDELEIIIVDDGSKDHTAEIAENYQRQFPESIRFIKKENGGHGSTINAALAIATGKYFKIVDGDDWVDIVALDDLLDYAINNSPDVIINNYNKVYDQAIHPVLVFEHLKEKNIFKLADLVKDRIPFYPMHSMTVKTELLRKSGQTISEHCFYVDNELIFYSMMNCETLSFLSGSIYQHRLGVNGQSVSPEGLYKHIEDLMHVLDKLFTLFQKLYGVNISTPNSRYLFNHISNLYVWLFWAYCFMQNKGKDNLLKNFDVKFRKKFAYYIDKISMGKYGLIPKGYGVFLPILRTMRALISK